LAGESVRAVRSDTPRLRSAPLGYLRVLNNHLLHFYYTGCVEPFAESAGHDGRNARRNSYEGFQHQISPLRGKNTNWANMQNVEARSTSGDQLLCEGRQWPDSRRGIDFRHTSGPGQLDTNRNRRRGVWQWNQRPL